MEENHLATEWNRIFTEVHIQTGPFEAHLQNKNCCCHYANELLVRVRHTETIRKTVWEKSNNAYSSIRVQTTINHISIFTSLCFLRQYQRQRKCFFFFFQSASWKRHCATHWREQRGWDLVIFYWFVLSLRMQVILDSSFARPGSAPIWGGKKGEFRDWTITSLAFLTVSEWTLNRVWSFLRPCLQA